MTRSSYEVKVGKQFPSWNYCTGVNIPYIGNYIPDFDTGTHYIEIKGTLDRRDRAKLLKVRTMCQTAGDVHIRHSSDLDQGCIDIITECQEKLRRKGIQTYVGVMYTSNIKPIVLAPYCNDKIIAAFPRIRMDEAEMKTNKDVLSNIDIIRWARLNQFECAPWNEHNFSLLEKYGKTSETVSLLSWDSGNIPGNE